MYKKGFELLKRFFRVDQIFKVGFNLSPMYRRSVGRLKYVSRDLHCVKIEIPINYKNRNYAGSIFGGSLFAATDPIYMVQLIQILGNDFIVWDKSAFIDYKRPARSRAYATFEFTEEEIEHIRNYVNENGRLDHVKTVNITNADGAVFATVEKTLFISTKAYYKAHRAKKKKENNSAKP